MDWGTALWLCSTFMPSCLTSTDCVYLSLWWGRLIDHWLRLPRALMRPAHRLTWHMQQASEPSAVPRRTRIFWRAPLWDSAQLSWPLARQALTAFTSSSNETSSSTSVAHACGSSQKASFLWGAAVGLCSTFMASCSATTDCVYLELSWRRLSSTYVAHACGSISASSARARARARARNADVLALHMCCVWCACRARRECGNQGTGGKEAILLIFIFLSSIF